MRKWLWLLLPLALLAALLLLLLPTEQPLPPLPETGLHGVIVAEHTSDTLQWRIEEIKVDGVRCYLTRVSMKEPGRQIGKATADWEVQTLRAEKIAERAPEASLIITGSGYVTKVFSWIPENYPGVSEDYWNTPLGSVTVTDGEVFRCLEGVPYYGLTLDRDGLRLHVGEDPEQVLARKPTQTWSFYQECPIIAEGKSILDPDWNFTRLHQMRNIICKLADGSYLNLIVTNQGGSGLTMRQCVDWLLAEFAPEWAYNLDGGPSAALMYRTESGETVTVWPSRQNNADIMTFSELPDK